MRRDPSKVRRRALVKALDTLDLGRLQNAVDRALVEQAAFPSVRERFCRLLREKEEKERRSDEGDGRKKEAERRVRRTVVHASESCIRRLHHKLLDYVDQCCSVVR